MKPKKMKKHKKPHRRNNGGGGPSIAPPRPRTRSRLARAAPPPWKTIGAAVAGSIGSAIASGLVVNQKIAEPDTVALLMAATGGLGAYLTEGNARVAFTGVAAAGAGQYALVKLGKLAEQKAERDQKAKATAEVSAPSAAPALPAPSSPPPPPPVRQHAQGGVVVDLFRDTASDLELVDDDEIRYSTRDAYPTDGTADDTPIEIEIDEAA